MNMLLELLQRAERKTVRDHLMNTINVKLNGLKNLVRSAKGSKHEAMKIVRLYERGWFDKISPQEFEQEFDACVKALDPKLAWKTE
jgi:hypothetical protein